MHFEGGFLRFEGELGGMGLGVEILEGGESMIPAKHFPIRRKRDGARPPVIRRSFMYANYTIYRKC